MLTHNLGGRRKMIRIIITLIILVAMSICAFSQTNDEHKKLEFFIGYSFGQADTDYSSPAGIFNDRANHHGFNVSAVRNMNRYFGVKADMSGTYSLYSPSLQVPSAQLGSSGALKFRTKNSLYNFLGGIQIKDNSSKGRLKPFVHVLVGAGYRRNIDRDHTTCPAMSPCPGSNTDAGLAGVFGGGLDFKGDGRISFRAFQVDYNPVKHNTGVDHKMRISAGIVFKK
jgi:hypothetical protein